MIIDLPDAYKLDRNDVEDLVKVSRLLYEAFLSGKQVDCKGVSGFAAEIWDESSVADWLNSVLTVTSLTQLQNVEKQQTDLITLHSLASVTADKVDRNRVGIFNSVLTAISLTQLQNSEKQRTGLIALRSLVKDVFDDTPNSDLFLSVDKLNSNVALIKRYAKLLFLTERPTLALSYLSSIDNNKLSATEGVLKTVLMEELF